MQRNCRQFIRSPPNGRKINRKITLVFHYFAHIEKNASQLFCTGDIENINQAIDIYEKYGKKLLSTFYLLIKIFWQKIIPEEENITFDRKYEKRASIFTCIKKFKLEKKFSQKNFFLFYFFDEIFLFFCFCFWWEFFLVRNFFLTLKNFPTKKISEQKYFYLLKNYSRLEFCW